MPKPQKTTGPVLPSKADILAFVAREKEALAAGKGALGKVRKREIARAFGIKGDDRVALKRLLRELEDEGQIEKHRSAARTGAMPAMMVADILSRDRDGELIAKPTDWDVEVNGAAPRILVDVPKQPRPGHPLPGVGDRALLRVEAATDAEGDGPAFTGRVVKLIAKNRARLLGVLRIDRDNGVRVQPVDKKNSSSEFFVPME